MPRSDGFEGVISAYNTALVASNMECSQQMYGRLLGSLRVA